jgi:hypothetical protein
MAQVDIGQLVLVPIKYSLGVWLDKTLVEKKYGAWSKLLSKRFGGIKNVMHLDAEAFNHIWNSQVYRGSSTQRVDIDPYGGVDHIIGLQPSITRHEVAALVEQGTSCWVKLAANLRVEIPVMRVTKTTKEKRMDHQDQTSWMLRST